MRVAVFLLVMSGCGAPHARPAPLPAPTPATIRELGGFYQPWNPLHETHWQEVLACVGVDVNATRPTVWIAAGGLTQGGVDLAGLYDLPTNAIVISLEALPYYWLVFRHEAIHAAAIDRDHQRHFSKARECRFWPAQ